MLRIGIIGCGQIAKVRHLPEYSRNPDCELIACFDINEENTKKSAQTFGLRACNSLESLFDCRLDAVSICVSNAYHCTFSIKALQAGLHVLCEKPMAMNIDDCYKMVDAAKQNNRILMIGQNQRYNKTHIMARELLKKDAIGKLLGFRLCFGHSGPENWSGQRNPWFFRKDLATFGALADLGVHKFDLLRFISGMEITEVSAMAATLDKTYTDNTPIDVDDNAVFLVKLDNGAIGTICASWTFYSREDNSTILYGTKGMMEIYADPNYSIIVHSMNQKNCYNIDEMTTNEKQFNGIIENTGIVDAFINAILSNQKPISSAEDVLRTMEAVFAADKAAVEKRTIVL